MPTLAFVHTPKTGGSSIRETYKGKHYSELIIYAEKGEKNSTAHGTLEGIDSPFDVSFAVIREPREWLYSLWHFTFHNKNVQWLNQFPTFEDFLLKGGLEKVKGVLGNNTQSDWVKGVDKHLLFDDLENQLNSFLEEHGIKTIPLLQLKKGPKKVVPKLSEEAENALNEHLKNDFLLYNKLLTNTGEKSGS